MFKKYPIIARRDLIRGSAAFAIGSQVVAANATAPLAAPPKLSSKMAMYTYIPEPNAWYANKVLKVGNATVTAVPEVLTDLMHLPPRTNGPDESLYRKLVVERRDLIPEMDNLYPIAKVFSWLVELDGRKILVSPGYGNGKHGDWYEPFPNLQNRFLEYLAAAGAKPEEIDIVLITHLHMDHVGWSTKWNGSKWVPTFPNARYYCSKAEFDHFNYDRPDFKFPDWAIGMTPTIFAESVKPLLEAGVLKTFEGDTRIEGLIDAIATPGHTAGETAYAFTSGGDGMAFAGDMFPHPIQVVLPELWAFSELPDIIVSSRLKLLNLVSDRKYIFAPSHEDTPIRITRKRDAFTYTKVPMAIGKQPPPVSI